MISATLYLTDKPWRETVGLSLEDAGFERVTTAFLVQGDNGSFWWDAVNGDEIGPDSYSLEDAIQNLRATYSGWPWHLEWTKDYRDYTAADLDA